MTARILFIDIETTPIVAYSWGPDWKTNLIEHIEESHLLSVAYRWGIDGETKILSLRQFGRTYRRNRKDDSMLARAVYNLLDEADIVVAHNGVDFDTPKLFTRFVANGIPRPSPFYQVDTKRIASKQWRTGSNRLQSLGQFLGLGSKTPHTGFKLWQDVMAGDQAAWDLMEEYNIQDVDLLVKLYLVMRDGGWIPNHPSLTTISGTENVVCRVCGGSHLQKRGLHHTKVNSFQQFQCMDCRHYSRARTAITKPPADRLV